MLLSSQNPTSSPRYISKYLPLFRVLPQELLTLILRRLPVPTIEIIIQNLRSGDPRSSIQNLSLPDSVDSAHTEFDQSFLESFYRDTVLDQYHFRNKFNLLVQSDIVIPASPRWKETLEMLDYFHSKPELVPRRNRVAITDPKDQILWAAKEGLTMLVSLLVGPEDHIQKEHLNLALESALIEAIDKVTLKPLPSLDTAIWLVRSEPGKNINPLLHNPPHGRLSSADFFSPSRSVLSGTYYSDLGNIFVDSYSTSKKAVLSHFYPSEFSHGGPLIYTLFNLYTVLEKIRMQEGEEDYYIPPSQLKKNNEESDIDGTVYESYLKLTQILMALLKNISPSADIIHFNVERALGEIYMGYTNLVEEIIRAREATIPNQRSKISGTLFQKRDVINRETGRIYSIRNYPLLKIFVSKVAS